MILYNVTIKLDKSIHDEWLKYMKSKHVKEVLDTGHFISCRMSRMQLDEDDPTYSIQYLLESHTALMNYQKQHAQSLQSEHQNLFKDKYVAFRSVMEVVHEDIFTK